MTLEHALLLACAVLATLAIVAWASAWKTMEWLGDAEDLLERLAARWPSGGVIYRERYTAGEHLFDVREVTEYERVFDVREVTEYRRRTPRRST